MVDDEFVANLPADPLLALKCLVAECSEIGSGKSDDERKTSERKAIDLLALAITILKKYSVNISNNPPEMTHVAENNLATIKDYFKTLGVGIDRLGAQNLLQASLFAYERELDVGFHYEFSDGEIERLQALINELRNAINRAGYLDEDHRRRLLARLEKLQAELHKRVSDLDVFLGAVVQFGATAGRFGEEAKPLVDRAREIGQIVAAVFRRAEKLQPGSEFPMLPKSDDPDE